MPVSPTTLDQAQQDLIAVVKAAHKTLILARQTRSTELARRNAAAKLEAKQEYERKIEDIEASNKLDIDREIAQHASAEDEALIAAFEAGIPVRRIALDGFGNQFDGAVVQKIRALREDGRVGSKIGYQRNTTDPDDLPAEVVFPEPIDVDAVLEERTTVAEPVFRYAGGLTLVPESVEGAGDGIDVDCVTLSLDPRDPWFAQIAKNMRPGTKHAKATSCTLYLHPSNGELAVHESKETGDTYWDHPVARWVKDHPDAALAGFQAEMADPTPNA